MSGSCCDSRKLEGEGGALGCREGASLNGIKAVRLDAGSNAPARSSISRVAGEDVLGVSDARKRALLADIADSNLESSSSSAKPKGFGISDRQER